MAEPVPTTPTTPTTPPNQAGRLTRLLDGIGSVVSWVWLALIGVIVLAVVLRFVFGIGRIELEELQWHLYAIGFLSGIVGCAVHDRHVRVDVLRERMSPRLRDWIDLYGLLIFQIPFVVLVLYSALPLVYESFISSEKSASAGGLPYRWVIKAVLPIAFAGVGFASFLQLRATWTRLFHRAETSKLRGRP
jgi:TRAP-type mannitol/chloroaromatic compound transport system permease small subunit